jgi:hypothetical protein
MTVTKFAIGFSEIFLRFAAWLAGNETYDLVFILRD